MKYIGSTKLPHGIVMHYSNSNGNVESCFIENDSQESMFIDIDQEFSY